MIQNVNVTGYIVIQNSNVTLDNVCVTTHGGANSGSVAVKYVHGSNLLIENSTIAGANNNNDSIEMAVFNAGGGSGTISHVYMHYCGACVIDGPWQINDSYIISDGMQPTEVTGDHTEDVYINDGTISLLHDTLLNPEAQTAVVFGDIQNGNGGPCANHITLTNSLAGGGGYMLYACAHGTSSGTSSINISNNRFARCTTPPITYNSQRGGYACQGSTDISPGSSGADGFGFWPHGGYFGIDANTYCAGQTWSGNVWDNNNQAVGCQGS